MEKRIYEILKKYGYTITAIRGPERHKEIVECRREIARIIRDEGYSYPYIGKYLNRDHTTAIHLVHPDRKLKKMRDYMAQRSIAHPLS